MSEKKESEYEQTEKKPEESSVNQDDLLKHYNKQLLNCKCRLGGIAILTVHRLFEFLEAENLVL